MGLPIEFYVYVGYGLFAMVVVVVGINWILGGLFGPFFKVKRSRGRMIMVRVHHPVQDFFRAGYVEEGWLIYKDREGKNRRIKMVDGVVSRAATVYWCEVDDEKNCFFMRADAKPVSTYDANKTDSLLTRAMYKPALTDDRFVKFILVIVIIGLLVSIVAAFFSYRNSQSSANTLAVVRALYNTTMSTI